ncbi:hypothetical protein HYI16_17155 [Clostridium botulinum]|uniref:hypothetical protein n=1 Tax=Clostridium botulinum TaxID=1491 RepID=UPI001C9A3188|nr:hypothetical protein [Clostridium botulinum]MBY7043769.1 hypothetical protein [Clostridium botulinum]
MEKIFILLVCGTIYTFTFINVIRLSGKNYKEENRWKLRMLTITNLLVLMMYIGMEVILN